MPPTRPTVAFAVVALLSLSGCLERTHARGHHHGSRQDPSAHTVPGLARRLTTPVRLGGRLKPSSDAAGSSEYGSENSSQAPPPDGGKCEGGEQSIDACDPNPYDEKDAGEDAGEDACPYKEGEEECDAPIAEIMATSNPGPCNFTAEIIKNPKFRSFTGFLNNIVFPTWGMTMSPYNREGKTGLANFSDGCQKFRRAADGKPLPPVMLPRTALLSSDEKFRECNMSHLAMFFFQMNAHDTALAQRHDAKCCGLNGEPQCSEKCADILTRGTCFFWDKCKRACNEMIRTVNTCTQKCPKGKADIINTVSHYLDMSLTYGSDSKTADSLREFVGGHLKSADLCGCKGMPRQEKDGQSCSGEICFKAGDARVNQTPVLACLQTVLHCMHNYIAGKLAEMNKCWDDERLYQEARRILIAIYQHITYNDLLPVLLGHDYCRETNLLSAGYGEEECENGEYRKKYERDTNAATIHTYSGAGGRFLHTFILQLLHLVDQNGNIVDKVYLSDTFNAPDKLCEGEKGNQTNNCASFLRGAAKFPAQRGDRFHTRQVTDYMNAPKGDKCGGIDLITTDIQRNRDYGLGSFNDMREKCGLQRANNFDDLKDTIPAEVIEKLKKQYGHVDDIDLTVGMAVEKKARGAKIGPVARCILREQYYRWKFGDRFFYEWIDQPYPFSCKQLNVIKKVKFAQLLCLCGCGVERIQENVFIPPNEKNPEKDCKDFEVIDWEVFKDKDCGEGCAGGEAQATVEASVSSS